MLLLPNIQSPSLYLLFAAVLLLVLGILLCSRSLRYWWQIESVGLISVHHTTLGRKSQTMLYGIGGIVLLGLGISLWMWTTIVVA